MKNWTTQSVLLMSMLVATALTTAEADLFRFCIKCAKPAILRSMREFAEQEIRLPDGPFEGDLFNCERQPFAGLWLDAVDSGKWNRICTTGPTQSGKSLLGFVIPTMYHLFEVQEKVICGLPSMEMAADKWKEDFLPAIQASRYGALLPTKGTGSRGGKFESIRFKNGVTLKFMSGGGNDKKRASFTARVLVITETDGMDESGESSREADKIAQMEGRTRSYGGNKRIYMECTVSIEKGRTWQEYLSGTKSRIVLPCPHCGEWVTPEREHFRGWQGAENEIEAGERGHFSCPSCSGEWTDEQRAEANRNCRLVHRGQSVTPDGEVQGEPPKTNTLAIRWSAVNNSFATSPQLGSEEWKASQAEDEENAEKERLQFAWALPHAPSKLDAVSLDARTICSRLTGTPKGVVPRDATQLTLGIDIGKRTAHWVLIAWMKDARGVIADYGVLSVPSDGLGVEPAILAALRDFRDNVLQGWPTEHGQQRVPDQVWIDSGWQKDPVYAFCKESTTRFRPSKGFAANKLSRYSAPQQGSKGIVHIGDGYHVKSMANDKINLVEVNVDHWKSWLHQRLTVSVGAPGSLVLHKAEPVEHLSLAKHLTSEKETEEFIHPKGMVTRWESVHSQNHWFDAATLACAAGHLCGVKLIEEKKKPRVVVADATIPAIVTPDGRPFLITEREA